MVTETSIKAAHDRVRGLDAQADQARAARDTLLRAAYSEGVSAYRLAKITGLTERAIGKVVKP